VQNVEVMVNLQVFPLSTVKSALYVLSERIDGRFGEEVGGRIGVNLVPIEKSLDAAQVEREFNAALIAASVNEHAFQAGAPIRNYLAQTAFSITTENQQTIEEFAASLGNQCAVEHAGAPSDHVDISGAEYDERTTSTPAGNRLLVEEDNGQVVLFIDTRRYLLPDVLWAANEIRDRCACAISNLPGNRLTVQLKPHEEGAALGPLCEVLERWLNIAVERSR
jgi:hypothetical protein